MIDDKLTEGQKIIIKYPNKIPIIINKFKYENDLQDINKTKYIVPNDMTFTNLIYIIRKKININSEKSIFITTNGKLCKSNSTLGELYDKYKNMNDHLLYFEYSSENTFG